MITLSRTSCRNVCAIQEMIVTRLPVAIAPGSDTSAMIANAIAHHIVPTNLVICPPAASSTALTRFIHSPSAGLGDRWAAAPSVLTRTRGGPEDRGTMTPVSYTHLRAH